MEFKVDLMSNLLTTHTSYLSNNYVKIWCIHVHVLISKVNHAGTTVISCVLAFTLITVSKLE